MYDGMMINPVTGEELPPLRFDRDQLVLVRLGSDGDPTLISAESEGEWRQGVVAETNYRQEHWDPSFFVPYLVQLEEPVTGVRGRPARTCLVRDDSASCVRSAAATDEAHARSEDIDATWAFAVRPPPEACASALAGARETTDRTWYVFARRSRTWLGAGPHTGASSVLQLSSV